MCALLFTFEAKTLEFGIFPQIDEVIFTFKLEMRSIAPSEAMTCKWSFTQSMNFSFMTVQAWGSVKKMFFILRESFFLSFIESISFSEEPTNLFSY